MKFFELHISDYQRKTAHLSLAEHGAYLQMLFVYYGTEKPLPPDTKLVSRLCRCSSRAERSAVARVLKDFWTLTPEGYVNPRAVQVLDDYLQWVATQRAKGRAGAASRWHSSGHDSGDSHGHSSGNGRTHGRQMASHSDLPLRPTTDPQPPEGGRPAAQVNGSRRRPREERDASLDAWREITPVIDDIAHTAELPPEQRRTWADIGKHCTDVAAVKAAEQIGFRLIADRDKFTTSDLQTRFREAYERLARTEAHA